MDKVGKAERLIQASGCGPFQVMTVIMIYFLMKIPANYTMMFMSFGSYNPGWRCLDNASISDDMLHSGHKHDLRTNITSSSFGAIKIGIGVVNETNRYNSLNNDTVNNNLTEDVGHVKGTCPDYKACSNVEFNPDVSTLVTEWGLLCDNDWIPSLIISIQMAGLVVGEMISGHLGDAIGRKKVLYIGLLVNGFLDVVTIFVPSWEIFAVVRFLFGVVLAFIISQYCILPYEFIPIKWRGRLLPFPAWPIAGVLMSVSVLICKDWKIYHGLAAIFSFACCLTAFCVPESLRWLEVKNKTKEFDKAARKIIAMNKLNISVELNNGAENDYFVNGTDEKSNVKVDTKRHTLVDIFRKGYRLYSVIFSFIFLSVSLIYYAINFGVKAMSGNFFINLIINFIIEIPFSIFPIFAPNLIGRKRAAIVFMSFTTCCLLVTAIFDRCTSGSIQHVGTLILALLAKTSANNTWYMSSNLLVETYPTSVRSIAYGFAQFMARVGGVLAPVLIPRDEQTVFICYIVMGVVGVVSCLLMTQLTETRGKQLKETFTDT